MKIELQDASYVAGSHNILSSIQFCVEGAQQAVIIGRSGSGKTTFARLLSGTLPPSVGSCSIDGLRTEIGFVEHIPTFHENLSAFDNVLFAAAARGLEKERAATQALELFADLHISHIRSLAVCNLSSWERTLVAVARAWIGETSVIIADQALDGCDEVSLRSLLDTLTRINTNQRSVVITTSQPSLALLMPNASVYELRDGGLVNISNLPSAVLTEDHGEHA
jgi:ABC-type multidrug transport system ATPase subunit